jgi:hypothetical protein
MRRMAGLELDGWRDYACRGWQVDGETTSDSHVDLVEGGHASVVVSHHGTTIGGPQAMLSPIGRGGGWGEIGQPTQRRPLAALWSGFLADNPAPSWASDLRAATDALTRQAQDIVFCMPDRPQMDEARQQALLGALSGAKRPRVTLLWRPVAMLLGWLATAEGGRARDGMRVACLQHASDGFEVQHLTLRALQSDGELLVPERAGFGHVVAPHLGLQALRDAAEQATARANDLTLTALLGRPRLPDDLLFAACPTPKMEVFRLENADWRLLSPPSAGLMPDGPQPVTGLDDLAADIVLLSTPLAERHHSWLRAAWRPLRVPVQILAPGDSARGSLQAARRIARGIPHYLDRLDQIALVVLRQGEPVFEDLIPANAIIAGNREYVSLPITNMVWGEGMASAQFFLRKGAKEIRRWITPEVPAPDEEKRLVIQLKQRPAQGWAVLTIGSDDWDYLTRNPIRLDWMTLEHESRSEEEILASLSRPKPIVPDRIYQRPGMLPWEGTPDREGLASLLARFDLDRPGYLADLAKAIRWNPIQQDGSRIRAIGTDGDLPPELSRQSVLHLQQAIESLAEHLEQHVSSGRGLHNNDALLALTWMFERCPAEITREIICALNCALDGRQHVFLAAMASTTVVMHGAGRTVREAQDLFELIPKVVDWLGDARSLNNGLGLLAALLSRPAETPRVLLRLDMDHLAEGLLKMLRRLVKGRIAGSRLKYTLIAIAGLLRVRELDPWALVVDRSLWAASLVKVMEDETGYLRGSRTRTTSESFVEVIKMLQGRGGRPDIFSILETIED